MDIEITALGELAALGATTATTSATSTDQSSFTSRFFASLFTRLTQWFANAQNGIQEIYAHVFKGEQLCLGETCITEPELQQLLDLRSQPTTAADAPSVGADETPAATPADAGSQTAITAPATDPVLENTPAEIINSEPANDNGSAIESEPLPSTGTE